MIKIPEIYLDEFLKKQALLIKSRTQLAAFLFVTTFVTGSLVATIALNEELAPQLVHAWLFAACASILILTLSRKVITIRRAKFNALLMMVMSLVIMTWYYITESAPPFNAAMTYLFMFLGFSFIFPWFPKGITGVLLIHFAGYMVFLVNVQTYIYKGAAVTTEMPDYLQGFIIMFLAFWLCFIVSRRERRREIENFILLKEVESKNRQMQKELEMATRVHKRLVPHSAKTPLADLAVTYLPVSYMSGDYAKFHFIDKNKLIFIICDVTGHGVSAALLVNALNAEFERLAKERKSPGVLLKELDAFITKDFAEMDMYLTAFCGLLDYTSMKFVYSNYGHPPQYIYRTADSTIQCVAAQRSFLGLPIEDDNIYQSEIAFSKGDQIFLFTDGVIEAKDRKGREYGSGRLEDFIKDNQKLHLDVFNENLIDELNLFTGHGFKDDIFILNIRIK